MTWVSCARHRDLRADPERAARHPVRRAVRRRIIALATSSPAPPGAQPVSPRLVLALPVRPGVVVDRRPSSWAVHLLGLGHLSGPQRGDEGPAAPRAAPPCSPRSSCWSPTCWSPRGDRTPGSARRDGLNKADNTDDVLWSSAAGRRPVGRGCWCWRYRSRPSRRPRPRSCRPRAARSRWPCTRPSRSGSPRVHPRYRTPVFLHARDGDPRRCLLRRHDADQRERSCGLDPFAGPRDRVLLRHHRVRVRLVLPQELFTSPRNFFFLPLPAARRPCDDLGVRQARSTCRSRLRLHRVRPSAAYS